MNKYHKTLFRYLNVGDKFIYNSLPYTKQSSRTAKMGAYDEAWFYFTWDTVVSVLTEESYI